MLFYYSLLNQSLEFGIKGILVSDSDFDFYFFFLYIFSFDFDFRIPIFYLSQNQNQNESGKCQIFRQFAQSCTKNVLEVLNNFFFVILDG